MYCVNKYENVVLSKPYKDAIWHSKNSTYRSYFTKPAYVLIDQRSKKLLLFDCTLC